MRILVIGASGSGTTTLGRAVADALSWEFLDGDDFYWLPTNPPFQEKRDRERRLSLILDATSLWKDVVISGSVVSWGPELEDSFSLIVFLTLDPTIRVARLRSREVTQLGSVDEEFLEWAGQYDEGRMTGRSRKVHEEWLSGRNCPILRIDGDFTVEHRLERVLAAIRELR